MEDLASLWAEFCERIKVAGTGILESARDLDEVNRAEGLRYLTRLLRGAFEKYIEYSDPYDPVLFKLSDERSGYGGPNPDNLYSGSAISDQEEYEIRGQRGSIGRFNFSIFRWEPGGQWHLTSLLEGGDLRCEQDGSFRLALGGARKEGNWMPLAPGSNLAYLRQTFTDRATEVEVKASIRLVSKSGRVTPLTVAQSQEKLAAATKFFCDTGGQIHGWSRALTGTVNQLPPADPRLIAAGGGDPNAVFFWSSWRLERGQALLVQLPDYPADKMWNLVVYNFWLEALDYTNFQIYLNSSSAHRNADGSITMIICDEDPKVANWLNTCGHAQGNIMMRCWNTDGPAVTPRTELIDLATTDLSAKFHRWPG